ncbi:bifunctional phosphoribosylaminoimidazolecarboxamide formyltransferase/IMP cyclohydrolase [Scardovia inopinata]|uniref:Bifunctional purine biosynthesis protein PurH n=1 Tax=Scardovia inopinata F0304 TaxID=641146 RepID=W5IJD2_SCAIO|nr:bifunctional phosphoribosylaminoimidazolecarboxamide formyltransferase/IMP cyclohydrolase [Scardovia inopinata]EFG27132.1 bifunctional purine biosynthesis protein purH [Scardovia inopinata F0304]BAR06747.1 phosphoribosylaminoimidazolecarboxamide formyltransferase/IMP cyclohydrolase [Scardovia inopinata JCM 12537]SUV50806.1 bifunctional phosphoribosylaminoimidazolecarboxamide formyltransferase/IMP cyclohydrolase [Scardovia inopinata]
MDSTYRPLQRVLVSVFHKEGLEVLAQAFIQAGTEVVSTGSTASRLKDLGVPVTPVGEVTGFPESLEGRVKTLDPHIHAGILADMTNPDHARQLKDLGIKPFDAVIVNLYPFADTVRSGADQAAVIEKIDIGGPSMVRGAAKNSACLTVITDPQDYQLFADRVIQGQGFNLEERRYLAAKAFAHTAAYDAAIVQWASSHWPQPQTLPQAQSYPTELTRTWDLGRTLRYGENPHQSAALYVNPLSKDDFAHARQLGGKPMSYNNYVDADSAWRSVWDFPDQPAVAVVKHSNPCGLALGENIAQAHRKAHACDPMSAYGGVIAANRIITEEMAKQIKPIFTEVVVAPDYEPQALELLQTKKNLRILRVPLRPQAAPQLKPINGGLLVQEEDLVDAPGDNPASWTLVSGHPADQDTMNDLVFAWRAIRSVKSNAILIAHDGATVGIGMGQVNRVDSSQLAVTRANTLAEGRNRTQGAVAASDAFFPFPDGMEILAQAGVSAIVQPGGSIRDEEVFQAARKAGITMYTTGTRHFFH